MATISNGEGGLSVRNKLNEIINRVEGNATITNDVSFGDSNKLVFGAGSDLQIYHDAAASYVSEQGVGPLNILASQLNIYNATETSQLAQFNTTSSKLFHNNSEKLATTSTGIDVTGSITTDKSVNINSTTASTFGFIEMGGPSGAYIDMKAPASDDYDARIIYSESGNALSIITLADEAILLRHGDTTRLATKNSGVDITGDLNASAKLVADSYVRAGNGSGGVSLTHNDGYGNASITFNHEAGTPEQDGNAARIAVNTDASTDVSIAFQVGSGVTDGVATGLTQVATMFEGNINTTVPMRVTSGTETAPAYSFSGATSMGFYTTGSALRAATGGEERFAITSTGKVGMGVSNPTMRLDVDGGSLGTTSGDRVDMLRLSTLSSNADRLDFTIERLSSGTTWTSAAHRIQRRVDAVKMGYIQFGANDDDLITFGEGTTEHARIDGDGNLLLGGSETPASASGSFAIFNGTSPTGSVTDGVVLYAEDVSSSSELKVRDEAGNITTLSPHNFDLIPEGASEDMAWSYYSERDGKRINVDMLKAIRLLEQISGEKLVHMV